MPDPVATRPLPFLQKKKFQAGLSSFASCPSSCLCPCQLVKPAFMACRCFLYDCDCV